DLIQQPDGKLLPATTRILHFNTDGSIDSSFHEPILLVYRDNTVNFPEAYTVNLQSDGRILIGGNFTDINDAPPNPPGPALFGVARLNSDGTVDNTLTTTHKTGLDVSPSSFARQADGRTLIAFVDRGGTSALGDPAIPHNYGRLNSDGTLDTSFDPLASLPGGPVTAQGFSVLPNGNIFGWGTQDATGNFKYDVLLPDGTIADTNYTDDHNVGFDKAYPLTNGQVLVVNSTGAQSVVNNTELQRLNSNGSLDASFVLDASIMSNRKQRYMRGNLQTVAAGSAYLALCRVGQL